MNMDILEGKWKQLKGNVQQVWGELTNDDLDRIQGRYEELVGLVQERYGRSRAEAEAEVREFLNKYL
ncbi:MAG: CsbD family protein [Caldilinea sp.]|nr:CsbD family protein [Caldilinea sp.]